MKLKNPTISYVYSGDLSSSQGPFQLWRFSHAKEEDNTFLEKNFPPLLVCYPVVCGLPDEGKEWCVEIGPSLPHSTFIGYTQFTLNQGSSMLSFENDQTTRALEDVFCDI